MPMRSYHFPPFTFEAERIPRMAEMLERCRNDEAGVGVDMGDLNVRSTA